MNPTDLHLTLQLITWFFALTEFILGVYLLVLNAWHTANRHMGLLLFLFTITSYSLGALISATHAESARWATILLGMSAPILQPALLIASLVILKLDWVERIGHSRWRWLWLLLYASLLVPAALTLSDLVFKTRLYFTGLNPNTYLGGFANMADYTGGLLAAPLRIIYYPLFTLALFGFLLYVVLMDKKATSSTRRLGWIILVAQLISAGLQYVTLPTKTLQSLGIPSQLDYFAIRLMLTTVISTIAYAYAAFAQMISERRTQRGSMQARLALLVITVSVPVLIAVTAFIITRARTQIEADAVAEMEKTRISVSSALNIWVQNNTRALNSLSTMPAITSMNPNQQVPVLKAMAAAYNPDMYLVSVVGPDGINIARSDDRSMQNYSDRQWFRQAIGGTPVAYETVIGRTNGRPALVAAVPIRNSQGKVAGVLMFASNLDQLTQSISQNLNVKTGFAYVVDATNQVVINTGEKGFQLLQNLENYPAIISLRKTQNGETRFIDSNSIAWRTAYSTTEAGWGVIVQTSEEELFATAQLFQRVGLIGLIFGSILMLVLAFLTVRQSLVPIKLLTETVEAVTSGDMTRLAPIESQDEIGTLARTFNSLTTQLRDLITGLEKRVASRTRDLEKRAVQLQVTAEVAREAASIRDLEQLLERTVHLISDRFGFYHAGLFMIDDLGEYAVLRAASSEGGRRMLNRSHRLRVGQEGIVGYVSNRGEARIALDVGADAVFFNNPDLPQTRSEAGLPLIARKTIIGVLDVQSTQPSAFNREDLEILQVLADQVALAIDNVRLLSESETALRELRNLYGERVRSSWQMRLGGAMAFVYDRLGLRKLDPGQLPAKAEASRGNGNGSRPAEEAAEPGAELETEAATTTANPEEYVLEAPIELRGERLGMLTFRRSLSEGPWMPWERDLVLQTVIQVALALENARLFAQVQYMTEQERLIAQIASKTQGSLDLETVMRMAVEEIGQAMSFAKVQIRLNQ